MISQWIKEISSNNQRQKIRLHLVLLNDIKKPLVTLFFVANPSCSTCVAFLNEKFFFWSCHRCCSMVLCNTLGPLHVLRISHTYYSIKKRRNKKGLMVIEIIVNLVDDYCLLLSLFSHFTCLSLFFSSTLVDRRVYSGLLFPTLHASMSTFWHFAKGEKIRLFGTWLLWHFSI